MAGATASPAHSAAGLAPWSSRKNGDAQRLCAPRRLRRALAALIVAITREP
jgi:hypothetical protein